MRLVVCLLVVAGFLVNGAAPAWAQVAPTGSWATEPTGQPNQPTHQEGAGCSDGTYQYTFNGGTTAVRRYDPSTNTWTVVPNMPINWTYDMAAAYYNGNCYLFQASNTVQVLSTSSLTWSTIATTGQLGSHGVAQSAAVVGTSIYVTGGTSGPSLVTEFIPGPNTVNARANMSLGRYLHGSAYSPLTSRLYVFGNWSSVSNSVEEYNPSNNTWTPRTGINNGGSALPLGGIMAVTAVSGRIYVPGGNGNLGVINYMMEYDPLTDTWTRRANMTYSRWLHTVCGPIGGKLYVYGGGGSTNTGEEYTPPFLGVPPVLNGPATQTGSLGLTAQGGWTDDQVTFTANITDIDQVAGAPQQVRLEVQVRPSGGTWATATTVSSPLSPQGDVSVSYTFPFGGPFDWRYHAMDSYGNYTPNIGGSPDWIEFENNGATPDIQSDQEPPTAPVGVYPNDQDVLVPSLVAGDVTFIWNAATDNGPSSALRYTIEVAHNDAAFGSITASATGLVPTQATLNLAVSRYNYFYHVLATDIGGNDSAWSTVLAFRVVGDDGVNHSAGDAKTVCGFGATGTGLPAFLLAFAALALALRRR